MATRRPDITLDRSRVAMTSSGIMLGLAYLADVKTIEEVIELLRDGSVSGRVFVGVEIGPVGAPGLKAYETGGRSKPSRRRSGRGQR